MRFSPGQILLAIVVTLAPLDGQSSQDPSPGSGQDLEELDRQIDARQVELERLRDEIRLYERRIARQEQEEKDTLQILFDLEERISLTNRLVKVLETESRQLTKAISMTQKLIREGEEEIAALKKKLAARFVHIYKQRRASILELILTSDNWNQAAYRARYLKAAADYDRYLTGKVKEEIQRLEQQRQKLARDRARKQEALREK